MDPPLDLTAHTRIERIGTPFPTREDFAEGGRFCHLQIPFFPPVPIELLKYLYGDDVTHDHISIKDQTSILKMIHEQINQTAMYCGCGKHVLRSNAGTTFEEV
jgi:hypothetical protein